MKWPAGVPVVLTVDGETLAVTDYHAGEWPFVYGYYPADDNRTSICAWAIRAVMPLNPDAAAMLAIAKEGCK